MNIDDFMLTVGISLSVGLFLGYFLRDAVRAIKQLYNRYLKRARYFEQDLSVNKNKKHK
ncbi:MULTISPECIES: cellulose biosynthesis protein BcsF [Vibrio]|uniref:DUF3149 domain-containing protein n=1 Tax=Vibrio hyugaensis TaxID=1534743 RepID=A0ABQ5YDB4_9VIBR|nr:MULTISPECIES: cellulose biosynthesis protein BcsF [Vibrio]MCX2791210.1 cellulose biosynthesis protein BcsF [Vibrio sp. Sgm 5]GLR07035.1 hypothetical protein GCM10007906_46230 [Vibrio hyugaensis]